MMFPTQSCPSSRCPLTTIIVSDCTSAGQDPTPGTPRSARGLPRRSKPWQGAFRAMRVSLHLRFESTLLADSLRHTVASAARAELSK